MTCELSVTLIIRHDENDVRLATREIREGMQGQDKKKGQGEFHGRECEDADQATLFQRNAGGCSAGYFLYGVRFTSSMTGTSLFIAS